MTQGPYLKKYRIIFTFLIVLLSALSLSCEKSGIQDEPITIAISPWAGYAFALLADDLGYFDVDNKKQIKLIIYPSLNQSRTAYDNGNVDGMFSTMIEVVESLQKGSDLLNVILVTNYSNGTDQIWAKKEIETVNDLKGKSIGVEKESVGMYMLNRALGKHKVPLNNITLVHIDSGDMKNALEDNIIDAAISYSPYTEDIKQLAPNLIFHSGMIPNEVMDLLSINKKVIDDNTEKVKLFIKGWQQAYSFYRENPDIAEEMLKHHSFFSKINLTRDLSEIKIVDYKDQQDLFSKEGSLEKAYINITEQMNSQVSLNRKIDKNVIINKNILKLYPSASLLQE